MAADILVDLELLQGSRYQAIVAVSVEWLTDLTGYSARGQVRRFQTVDVADDPLAVLDPYLVVNGAASTITIDIPADVSSGWDWKRGRYDIEVYDSTPGHAVRVLQGQVTLNPEVTR